MLLFTTVLNLQRYRHRCHEERTQPLQMIIKLPCLEKNEFLKPTVSKTVSHFSFAVFLDTIKVETFLLVLSIKIKPMHKQNWQSENFVNSIGSHKL